MIRVEKINLSVIMPTYNRRSTVLNSLNSVLSQQTSLNYEVIIIDDGSTDDTWRLFRKIKVKKVRYYRYPDNHGVNFARNFGIKKAKGDYIILLDSDDVFEKDALQKIERNFKKLGECNFFGTKDAASGKKLYKTKIGYYGYREWLSGSVKKGIVIPVVKRTVHERYQYEEDMFGFMIYLFNNVIKEYGIQTFDETLTLVSFKEKNRMTHQMHRLEKAHQRYFDYQKYLNNFGDDYKKYRLYIMFSRMVVKKFFYFCLKSITRFLKYFKRIP